MPPIRPLHAVLCPVLLAALACGGSDAPAPAGPTPSTAASAPRPDPHSYALPDEARVTHLDLELDVDFARRVLDGVATLDLETAADAAVLHLDTRDLEIHEVAAGTGDELAETPFTLAEPSPILGRDLAIELPAGADRVRVRYSTSPAAAAVQWLDPAQTAGGEHPFLFTQSQAILARTWVPIQDSPAVRFTYDAEVRVPAGLMALMSAVNPTEPAADGVHSFTMPQAIPSYLLALAVGDLEFRAIGDRTGVYAEPSVVEGAHWEFAETQEMMDRVEPLYGPYRWGRYDILVLPPSFPFGGMENPRLTFATPTIIAGDRSLVALIAHELAHSWSGNLVTNATWNDFWLNEGFTVYLERRIMELLQGREYAEMLALLGRQDLEAQVADLGADSPETHLRLDLAGRDPDEGMTDIAYEKGYFFLRLIEESVGREAWDAFLRSWFDANAFESRTTDDFLEVLQAELLATAPPEAAAAVQVNRWVDGPGLPEAAPRVESDRFVLVEEELAKWQAGTAAAELATADWTSHEWLHFLRALPEDLPAERMAALDAAFGFTASGNSEILHAWLHRVIASGYEPGLPVLEEFLVEVGRRKFLEPLYRRLVGTEEGRARALAIYGKARPGYHSVATTTLDPIVGWEGGGA